MTKVERPFPARYGMELLATWRGAERVLRFPPQPPERVGSAPPEGAELPSLAVAFRGSGSGAWTGVFYWGYSERAATCITTLPDPGRAAVVAWGQGTLVDVDEPDRSHPIPIGMVLQVLPLVARELVVFRGTSGLCAYGTTGLLWESVDFLVDDGELGEVVDDQLVVRGWSIWRERDTVRVDLATGKVRRSGPSHGASDLRSPSSPG